MNSRVAALAAALLALLPSVAEAVPQGRAWSARETYATPGHVVFYVNRLEATADGDLTAMGTGQAGLPVDGQGLRWRDSTWTVEWSAGYPMNILLPSLGLDGDLPLVWSSFDEFFTGVRYESWLISSIVRNGIPASPDTVTSMASGHFLNSTASSKRRQWVAFDDYGNFRLLYSDSARTWHEVDVPGNAANGVGLAPVDDTTAIVAWSRDPDGLHMGTLRGRVLEEGAPPPRLSYPALETLPQFRVRPSGGWWMAWNTFEGHVAIVSLRDGQWFDAESLKCAYRSNGTIPDAWINNVLVSVSRDPYEYPVVVWGGYNGETGGEATCVCVPSDSGFTLAEDLPDLAGAYQTGVARDRWGDVWVAWHTGAAGMHFVHTYTKATCGAPTFEGSGAAPLVRWTLSEPAPGSGWTVMRSDGGAGLDSVGTVRATADTRLSWADPTAPRGVELRYRIRREHVDRRYQWLGPEATWYARTPALGLWLSGPHPVSNSIEFAVTGSSSGVLESRLYDLQGRLVSTLRTGTNGSGVDEVRIDFSGASPPVRSGIYFLRVVDGAGHISNSLRIAVIR